MKPWMASAIWLLAYVATMGLVVWGLVAARRSAMAAFDSPAARQEWQDFRSEMERQANDPATPVARKPPKSTEPPTLRLLRDHFATCLALALLLSTALFGTFMILIRGAFTGEKFRVVQDE